ncbi:hypothetical protein D3C81_2135630 [compost metagenome]
MADIIGAAFGTPEGGCKQAVAAGLGAIMVDVENVVIATKGAPVTIIGGQLGVVATEGHLVGQGAGVEVPHQVHVQAQFG